MRRQAHAFAVLWDNHDLGDGFMGREVRNVGLLEPTAYTRQTRKK